MRALVRLSQRFAPGLVKGKVTLVADAVLFLR
jgi:hypothetical protein